MQSERGMGLSSSGLLSDLAGFSISAVSRKGVTAGSGVPEQIIEHVHGGFLKWGYPQIIHFSRIIHYKPSIYWGSTW